MAPAKTYASRKRRPRPRAGSQPTRSCTNALTARPHKPKSKPRDATAILMAAARRKAKNKRKVADADDYKTKKHKKQSTSTSSKPSKGPSQPKLTQSILDAGQKDIHFATCSLCGMLYNRGQPDDEAAHKSYHAKYSGGIHFKGWKDELVVQQLYGHDARVIELRVDHSQKHVREKAKEVIRTMNRDLGGDDSDTDMSDRKLYAYVLSKSKRIVGALIVKRIDKAYRLAIPTGSRSPEITQITFTHPKSTRSKVLAHTQTHPSTPKENKKPLACHLHVAGKKLEKRKIPEKSEISSLRLQRSESLPVKASGRVVRMALSKKTVVTRSERRKGIATRLVDVARRKFIYGLQVPKEKVAFSHTTHVGRRFAAKFLGSPQILLFS
ncbi:hypothetical protein AAMO2058_001678600 [Amorphochlora amoebiformis]